MELDLILQLCTDLEAKRIQVLIIPVASLNTTHFVLS